MPIVFAENWDGFPPLSNYINVSQAPLNDCNFAELTKPIEDFLFGYFRDFLVASFQEVPDLFVCVTFSF
jgi:hypothetical protein